MSRFNQPQQQVQYGGNTYQNQNQSQGWQNNQNNHNYGWRNNQNSLPPPQVSKSPLEKKVLEEELAQMLTSYISFMNETKANMQNQSTQLNN